MRQPFWEKTVRYIRRFPGQNEEADGVDLLVAAIDGSAVLLVAVIFDVVSNRKSGK